MCRVKSWYLYCPGTAEGSLNISFLALPSTASFDFNHSCKHVNSRNKFTNNNKRTKYMNWSTLNDPWLFVKSFEALIYSPNSQTSIGFLNHIHAYMNSNVCVADSGGGDDHHSLPGSVPALRPWARSPPDLPVLHPAAHTRQRAHPGHTGQPGQHTFPGNTLSCNPLCEQILKSVCFTDFLLSNLKLENLKIAVHRTHAPPHVISLRWSDREADLSKMEADNKLPW